MTKLTASTRSNGEARRQQIVDAASTCARRAGFHGASMAEIAHAAGLSVGQIYRYFENKEAIGEILRAVIRYLLVEGACAPVAPGPAKA